MIEQLKDRNSLCLSCLVDICKETNLEINVFDYEEDSILFTIKDNESRIYNNPYQFKFLNQYSWK